MFCGHKIKRILCPQNIDNSKGWYFFMSEIKNAVIYARFSSDMQREESIEAQVRACTEYCRKKHYVVTNIYVDEAKSARDIIKRDAYNQMMADAIEHKFDVIIFHKIDRNARNEFNYYSFKNTLSQLGIGYEYAAQNIDFSPEGQMMENMLVGFAAYYSRNLAKETKKGLNENAYKAQFNGGKPPLGYKIVDKKYVIEPVEAEAVKLIFDLYISGHGYGSIARTLAAKGFKTREGRDFGKNSLYDILGNEKYTGTYTFNKTNRKENRPRNMHVDNPADDFIRIEDAIPAIISKSDFEIAKKIKQHNKKKAGSYKAKAYYLLSGKIFCGHCGSTMTGHRTTSRKKEYVYYNCNRHERLVTDKCPQSRLSRDAIEKLVLEKIEREIFSPIAKENISQFLATEYEKFVRSVSEKTSSLSSEKAIAERKLNNLYELVENGEADEFIIGRINKLKSEINLLQDKIKSNNCVKDMHIITQKEILDILTYLHDDVYTKNNTDAQQILINLFVDKVIVDNKKISLQLTTERILDMAGAEGRTRTGT